MSFNLLDALIQTKALRFSLPGEVFWYTSGTVGPYYINTHYLFGSSSEAESLLAFIDCEKNSPKFTQNLMERVVKQYEMSPIFRGVIDSLVDLVEDEMEGVVDAVSGGERRDWFFSLAVAARLDLPHVFIFKNLRKSILFDKKFEKVPKAGLNTLHVADLVTEASSYFRAWIPSIEEGDGQIIYSANVVDRGQGGIQALQENGVPSGMLLSINQSFFRELADKGYIDHLQAELLYAYCQDPYVAMKDFLLANPLFIRSALQSNDERTIIRAKALIECDPYKLNICINDIVD